MIIISSLPIILSKCCITAYALLIFIGGLIYKLVRG